MLNSRLLIFLASAVVLAGGCASSSTASKGGSRYVITDTELANVREQSAYEALQELRPTFLRSRDPVTPTHQEPTPIAVFINGGRTEGVDVLRTIRVNTVKEMRFYEPAEANTRFGTGHNGGVIAVTLK
ncbi:MAG TPA: hypothetical protein VFD67_06110 [Gemmatimonadaceae bacterium]|nr:hypothetical protein [Gemmatimonadaceae bacterium]